MAGNDAIHFLRGDGHNKSAKLLAGQPYFDYTNNLLYVGGKSGNDSISSLVPINAFYDTVIATQADFEAWYTKLDAGTFGGYSVLILDSTYTRSDGKGLHLPDTLKQLHGLGTVKINITNYVAGMSSYATNRAGIWYTTTPTTEEYSIKNISLSCTCSDPYTGIVPGFSNCTNLTNCTCSSTFTLNSPPSIAPSSYSFSKCTNLINCTGISNNNQGNASGFDDCNSLINCNGNGIGKDFGQGFNSCYGLINCVGASSGTQSYDFYNCHVCSNCVRKYDYNYARAKWGGSSSFVSKDTCPGYEN